MNAPALPDRFDAVFVQGLHWSFLPNVQADESALAQCRPPQLQSQLSWLESSPAVSAMAAGVPLEGVAVTYWVWAQAL